MDLPNRETQNFASLLFANSGIKHIYKRYKTHIRII